MQPSSAACLPQTRAGATCQGSASSPAGRVLLGLPAGCAGTSQLVRPSAGAPPSHPEQAAVRQQASKADVLLDCLDPHIWAFADTRGWSCCAPLTTPAASSAAAGTRLPTCSIGCRGLRRLLRVVLLSFESSAAPSLLSALCCQCAWRQVVASSQAPPCLLPCSLIGPSTVLTAAHVSGCSPHACPWKGTLPRQPAALPNNIHVLSSPFGCLPAPSVVVPALRTS